MQISARNGGLFEIFHTLLCREANVWAACYRIGAEINTNMRLEALHRVLKYCYLQGKQNRRIDRLISALLRLTKNKLFDRLIKFNKNVPGAQQKEISKRHAAGGAIPEEHVCRIEAQQWTVRSQSCEGVLYTVTQQDPACTSTPCILMCKECAVCIHSFSCTCVDHVLQLRFCKHIHAVAAKSVSRDINNTHMQMDQQVRCT